MGDKPKPTKIQAETRVKVAEVQRLGSPLAARVRYAQIVKQPISSEQIAALILAARLLKEYEAPWPSLMKQVLNELTMRLHRLRTE